MATWTPEEDKILKDLYETAPREEILSKLPGRIWKSCYKRSVILNLARPKDDAWTKNEDELCIKFYTNTPYEKLIPMFPGRTLKGIKWHAINVLRLMRSKEMADLETKKTNQTKLGVDYPTQASSVRKKVKETVQDRYGVDNVFQAEEIKKKIIKTNLENMGVENPQQNSGIKEKTKKTNQKKYGVDNPFQMRDRVQQGMLKKHGHKSPLQAPKIKAKQQATNIEKYGFPTPSKNIQIVEKIINTNLERYGVLAPSQNKKIKEKTFNTNFNRYGVTNPAKLEHIKEKARQTCLNKYGVEYTQQVQEFRDKGYKTSKINGSFESSDEEDTFGDYLRTLDPTIKQHVEHPELGHIIDFYMPKMDIWVQYDGTYWHGKTIRKNISERSKKIEKVKISDQFQNEKISNLIRFWSDEVLESIKKGTIFELIKNKFLEKNKELTLCHQFQKKLEWKQKDLKSLTFNPVNISARDFSLSSEKITPEIVQFIEKYEWLGTIGVPPKWCFTARYKGLLGGVILINEPTAYSKLLGESTPIYEALIQRGATASWAPKNLGSRLVMYSCHWMIKNTEKRLFSAYGDPTANEIGTIYQACGFDYLGQNFGNNYLFQHKEFKNKKFFSPQTLKRTSTFIHWCKNSEIIIQNNWFNASGFKDLKNIPIEVKIKWRSWIKKIIEESKKIKIIKKHKYVLLLSNNKKEAKKLFILKNYKIYPYPKRS